MKGSIEPQAGTAKAVRLKSIVSLVSMAAVAVSGCSGTQISWIASGDYRATLIGTEGEVLSTVSRAEGISSDERIRMCEIRTLSWSYPVWEAVRGRVAAITTVSPEPLCRLGTYTISGGSVLTWQSTGTDTSTVRALPTPGWTVTGTLTVTEYTNLHPEEPDVYEQAVTETAKGTFDLEATGPGGAVIRFEDGTFEFEVHMEKWPYNPFD